MVLALLSWPLVQYALCNLDCRDCVTQLDVWGLGIVMFGMVFGYAPFGEDPQTAEDFAQTCARHIRALPPCVRRG